MNSKDIDKDRLNTSGRLIVDRIKKAVGAKLDIDLADHLSISRTTISSWIKRDSIPVIACIQVSLETGVSLDELILGVQRSSTQPAQQIDNAERLRRIDLALFQACWDAARDLGYGSPDVLQFAVRIYNAAESSTATRKSLTLSDIGKLLLFAEP